MDRLASFSSGLAKEGFNAGVFVPCPDNSFLSSNDPCPFDLFFLDLIPVNLLEGSLAFLLTGIPNFAG